jgi:DNA-binding IclR family transcriptional regulator
MSEQMIAMRNSARARTHEADAEPVCARENAPREQPDKVVKSAGRVLRILEFFDARREAASVIDVARALRMPQSSTSVLLRSLTLMGYLDYDSRSRTYRPTSRVAILGNWVNPVLVQRGGVLDTMRDLSARTGLTALLTARNGLSAQHIYVVCPDKCVSEHHVSDTQPLAMSAAGELFLSLLPDLEVSKLIRRVNAYVGQVEKIVRVPDLLLRLAEIRKRGFVYHASDKGAGSATLAMLIPNAQGPLALGLAGTQNQIEGACDALAAMMRRHITALTQLDNRPVHLRQ